MHRRETLTLCGAGLLGLAGCASLRSDARDTTTSADGNQSTTPGGTTPTATPSGVGLTVELDALQPALVVLNVDYLDLYANASSQYLSLRLSAATDTEPTLSDLAFRFAGDSHNPLGPEAMPNVYRQFDEGSEPQYPAADGSGWLLFELPATGDASDAALVWPGGEWHPDERLRTRLAAPFPPLSVERWQVGPTVAPGGRTTFQVAVTNAGDVLGRFVGGLNADGWYPHRPIAQLSRPIPPGETVRWEVPGEAIEFVSEGLTEQVGDGDADIDYELRWPGGSRSASVRVIDG